MNNIWILLGAIVLVIIDKLLRNWKKGRRIEKLAEKLYVNLGLTEEQVKQVLTTWEHLAKIGWKGPRVGMALMQENDELRARVAKFEEQERQEKGRYDRSCSDCSKFKRRPREVS